MKKYLALLLMMALAAAPAALAEDAATPLPCGVSFEMDGAALVEAIGGEAEFVPTSRMTIPKRATSSFRTWIWASAA